MHKKYVRYPNTCAMNKLTTKKPKFVEPKTVIAHSMVFEDGSLSRCTSIIALNKEYVPVRVIIEDDYQEMLKLINRLMRGKR